MQGIIRLSAFGTETSYLFLVRVKRCSSGRTIQTQRPATKHPILASERQEAITMGKLAIWARLQVKPGKEAELEDFLRSAQTLAQRETGTVTWYAIKMGHGNYGIFDTFNDEKGRDAHLNGEI